MAKDACFPRSSVEDAKKSSGAGTWVTSCKQGPETLLWPEAIRGAAHGGRSTLEYQQKNPREAGAIHVVFAG